MITQIKGRLVEKNLTNVVIDCHGVGYYINISLNTHSQIGNSEELLLFTHLHIKEDSHTLYGFVTQNERSIFRLLISISGIGPSIARTMLSSMDPHEIQKSILGENLEAIKSIKGIGLKTAQRVLIELKDKVQKIEGFDENLQSKSNTIKEETLSALEVLGYSRRQTEKVIDNIIQSHPESSIEELIKSALNKL
ncbi:MAG: Holliday junction branch migration protein RuvA [Flavobacteriaceae bacterium]|jgi:Holliday junction DNA helicase RuvA|nr:MAG: Holliday junction branch migration protein RuvA [Flavobacteriaceae bacterium TMED220]|tara:strand:- start:1618 stop:2199 length:582 start_codon:yes stop_codon:yes gene_type:complete